jgi:hypothetical protein
LSMNAKRRRQNAFTVQTGRSFQLKLYQIP